MSTTTPATASNDNAAPTMDVLLSVLAHAVGAEDRWALEGWAAHMRPAKHEKHAANSWAKHASEFDAIHDAALALTLARCVDFGMTAEDARDLVDERVEARAAKSA